MVDLGIITGLSGTAIAIGGVWITLVKTRSDRQLGVAAQESSSKRDTIADRDSLLDQVQESLNTERTARREEFAKMEIRLSRVESELREEREYTDSLRQYSEALRHMIYRGDPPPPPPLPQRFGATAQPI